MSGGISNKAVTTSRGQDQRPGNIHVCYRRGHTKQDMLFVTSYGSSNRL